MVNATGWNELMDLNMVQAPMAVLNAAFGGIFLLILYLVFVFVLYMKTRNPALILVVGAIFTYIAIERQYVAAGQIYFLVGILVIQVMWVLYTVFWKND